MASVPWTDGCSAEVTWWESKPENSWLVQKHHHQQQLFIFCQLRRRTYTDVWEKKAGNVKVTFLTRHLCLEAFWWTLWTWTTCQKIATITSCSFNKLHDQQHVLTHRPSSRYVARDKEQLSRMGISHVVDAAAGRFRIDTGPKFYKDLLVDYYGVEAEDNPNFDLSIYFYPVARYIRAALNSPRGN